MPTPIVYNSTEGLIVSVGLECFRLDEVHLDALFQADNPAAWLEQKLQSAKRVDRLPTVLAPIDNQEVWAAGVTYMRSRDARIEESKDAGGGSFYDRVYVAPRPEIFFKATAHRVVGTGGTLKLRSDSFWNVPEPELALAINPHGRIFGYTVGNDLSSRDIEGENPLYLPQAKVWSQCCGLGPGVVVRDPLPLETTIELSILRGGETAFQGVTSLSQMKRTLPELVEWLYLDNAFPAGCYLLTGTGLVPPDTFTLNSGDEIRIRIDGLGTLVNHIA